MPVEGAGFGSAVNAEAIYTVADTLELYDGGMLDLSFLGAAEVDCHGNVNVSSSAPLHRPRRLCQHLPKYQTRVFTGTFTAGGLKEEVRDGRLVILQEGQEQKIPPSSGADHLFRRLRSQKRPGCDLPYGAGGAQADAGWADAHRNRPRRGAGAGYSGPDGVQAPDFPELREMDHRIFQAGPMGTHCEVDVYGNPGQTLWPQTVGAPFFCARTLVLPALILLLRPLGFTPTAVRSSSPPWCSHPVVGDRGGGSGQRPLFCWRPFAVQRRADPDSLFLPLSEILSLITVSFLFSQEFPTAACRASCSSLFWRTLPAPPGVWCSPLLLSAAAMMFLIPQPFSRIIILSLIYRE